MILHTYELPNMILEPCVDVNSKCEYYKGKCEYDNWIRDNCKLTCGRCGTRVLYHWELFLNSYNFYVVFPMKT